MTRRLLTFLGLPMAAQVMPTKPILCDTGGCREAELVIKPRKPANGECPVCGTVAEKYHRMDTWMEPPKRLVDCAHCRNAFYQDAETSR